MHIFYFLDQLVNEVKSVKLGCLLKSKIFVIQKALKKGGRILSEVHCISAFRCSLSTCNITLHLYKVFGGGWMGVWEGGWSTVS